MTEAEFNKLPFHYVKHVVNRYEHHSEYASSDGRLGLAVIIPYDRYNQPKRNEKRQVYYRIDNRTYPLKEDFLIALEYFNP